MTMMLPANVGIGKITGRFIAARLDDASDADTAPQAVAIPGLVILMTPRDVRTLKNAAESVTIFPEPVELGTDEQGYVIVPSTGERGAWIVATNDADMLPVNWLWNVQIRTPTSGVVADFDIALPQGSTVDLTTAVPVSPGTPEEQEAWVTTITQVQALVSQAQVEVSGVPDLVAETMASDAGIRAAAVAAMDDAAVQALLAWVKPSPAQGVDLNALQTPGLYPITRTDHANAPIASLGALEVLPMGAWLVQRFVSGDGTPRSFQRRKVVSGGNDVWTVWGPTGLRLGEGGSTTDLNLQTIAGQMGYNTTAAPNLPVAVSGDLEVLRLGTIGVTQRYTTWEVIPRVFYRRGSTNGSFPWTAWSQTPDMAMLDALRAEVLASLATVSGSGVKIAPLAVTMPGGTVLRAAPSVGAARYIRRYAHAPSRVRLHVSNRNPANASSGGAATITGARIGVGNVSTGAIAQQKDALPANTVLPVSGTAEAVGPWIDFPGVDGDPIGITLAWSGGTDQQMLQGGGWIMDGSTSSWSSEALASGFVKSTGQTPFYVWLEAEVPSRVSLVGAVGDSIVIGTSNGDPVLEAWLAHYALAENALPVMYAQHGSNSLHWKTGDQRWTSLYPGVTPALDAVIMALGRNDITAGITAATLRTRDADVKAAIAALWPRAPIFASSITPFASEDTAAGQVRRDHNVYRATLPLGERGFFDFAAAVGNAGGTALEAAYSADGLHPNVAGHQQMATRLIAAPPTPYVMREARQRALAAGSGLRDVSATFGLTSGKAYLRVADGMVTVHFLGAVAPGSNVVTYTETGLASVAPESPIDEVVSNLYVGATGLRRVAVNRLGNIRTWSMLTGDGVSGYVSWPMTRSAPAVWPGVAA